jgi:hypothetical protein
MWKTPFWFETYSKLFRNALNHSFAFETCGFHTDLYQYMSLGAWPECTLVSQICVDICFVYESFDFLISHATFLKK